MRPYTIFPRRRRSRLPKPIAALAVVAALAWFGVWLGGASGAGVPSFAVAQGASTAQIAADLKDAGVIRSALLFRRALAASGKAARLQPGTYDLSEVRGYGALIDALASGGLSAEELVLLVREGENIAEVRQALFDLGIEDDLFRVTGLPATGKGPRAADFSAEYPWLAGKPSSTSLEGFLYPDTYRIFKDATAEDVVRKMLENFDRKLTPELRAKIAASGRSVFETVTLASVVEQEVRGDEDRRKVADLFLRRLEIGMALQSDATVNYVTGKSHAAVSLEDTDADSPYNTYKYRGLPPGPICNPSLSSIAAVADPLPNDAWYFLTDLEGNVHYAKTFEQHVANKFRYLK